MTLCLHDADPLDICMKKYYYEKIFSLQNDSYENLEIFFWQGLSWADQLLLQFLVELIDIMPTLCKPIGHLHEEMLSQKNIFFTK